MEKSKDNFQCAVCWDNFNTLAELELHWGVHFRHYGAPMDSVKHDNPEVKRTVEKDKMLQCMQCKFTARLAFALNRHIKKVHNHKRGS